MCVEFFKNILKMRKSLFFILVLIIYSCNKDMDIPDTNDPNRSNVNSSSRDVENVAESAFLAYWQATRSTTSGGANLYGTSLVAADQFTASWYNFAWGYVSAEPRIPWNNLVTFDDADVTTDFYYSMYGVLSNSVNPVIDLILNKNFKLGNNGQDNPAILALCYFLQGAILGNLGLCFDKAMIVKENTDLGNIKFSSYNEVMDAAIVSLEKTDSICKTNTFQLDPSVVNGYLLNNDILKRLANSYMARFLALTPRTKVENSLVDWDNVLAHAQQGINNDFYADGDATYLQGGKWYDNNFYYLD